MSPTWSAVRAVAGPGGSLAAGDPAASRLVYGIVIALIVIGVLLVALAVWLIRQTRVDRELLAPLERMDDRDWRSSTPARRRRLLDEVRPEGAEHHSRPVPEPDEDFARPRQPVASFDDLEPISTISSSDPHFWERVDPILAVDHVSAAAADGAAEERDEAEPAEGDEPIDAVSDDGSER